MIRKYIKNYFRKQIVNKHIINHGEKYKLSNLDVFIPLDAPLNLKYSIICNRYEVSERRLIDKYLLSNFNIIELGGSLGILSKYIASKLDPNSKHVIVEANPNLIGYLKKNTFFETRENSTFIENFAIAYHDNEIDFHLDDDILCSRIANNDTLTSVKIPVRKLSYFVNKYFKNEKYILIMDIEGSEGSVFEFDKDILKNCLMVIVELHPKLLTLYGYTLESFLILAKEIGMKQIDKDNNVYVFENKFN